MRQMKGQPKENAREKKERKKEFRENQDKGGFQLEFGSISQVINHLLKFGALSLVENLFLRKNPLQDLLSSLNVVLSTMRALEL